MHDTRLEDQLRSALRTDGDSLPFTITADELERRLASRSRQRTERRMTLLAAGIGVVAIGATFALSSGLQRPSGIAIDPSSPPSASPSPTPSASSPRAAVATPVPTAVPTGLPDLAIPAGTVAVDTIHVPDPNLTGASNEETAGIVPPRDLYRIAFTCLGAGTARWDIGLYRLAGGDEQPCDGTVRETDSSEGVPPEDMAVIVTTSPQNRWHIIVTYPFDAPTFIAPQLFAFEGDALVGDASGGLARCVTYNGVSDSCAAPFLARDGADPVEISVDGEVGIALEGAWLIDRVSVDILDRDVARADPFSSGRRVSDIEQGGQRVQVPLSGVPAGEYVLRLILDASGGDDTFGGIYDIPLIIGG
jgi:hypothetical protein